MAINLRAKDACVATRAWMTEKQKLRFNKEFASKIPACNHINGIFDPELPRLWKEFHDARATRNAELSAQSTARAKLKVGHALLMACVRSQDAYVWQQVAEGEDALESMRFSFKTLINGYLDELKDGQASLPSAEELDSPLQMAVDSYSNEPDSYGQVIPTLRSIVGLTITGLLEPNQWSEGSPLRLPDPYVLSGEVIAREYPTRRPVVDSDY